MSMVARDGDDGGITGVFGVIVPHVVPVRGDVPAEADLDGVLPAGMSQLSAAVRQLSATSVWRPFSNFWRKIPSS